MRDLNPPPSPHSESVGNQLCFFPNRFVCRLSNLRSPNPPRPICFGFLAGSLVSSSCHPGITPHPYLIYSLRIMDIDSEMLNVKTFPYRLDENKLKHQVSASQFKILRRHGTEFARTGRFDKFYPKAGGFRCRACLAILFLAAAKFNSGSGWPSFTQGLPKRLAYTQDRSLGMLRTEVLCARCGSHHGHVFPDGPPKSGSCPLGTGKRYCINSACLIYDPGADTELAAQEEEKYGREGEYTDLSGDLTDDQGKVTL